MANSNLKFPVLLYLTLATICEGISSKVNFSVCEGHVFGSECDISCSVPDFSEVITFYHPPGTPVGNCEKDGYCNVANNNYILQRNTNKKKIVLSILKLVREDNGNWVCAYGAIESEPKLSHIYDKISVLHMEYVVADEYESVTLSCQVDVKEPTYDILWYFKNQTLENNAKYTVDSKERTLTINDAQDVDKGIYRCYIRVPAGSNNKQSGSVINLFSVHKDKSSDRIATIHITAKAGHALTLLCDINAKGQSNRVHWHFNGMIVNYIERYHRDIVEKGSLTITSVMSVDKGFYRCSMEVPAGSKNIRYGPYINLTEAVSNEDKINSLERKITILTDIITIAVPAVLAVLPVIIICAVMVLNRCKCCHCRLWRKDRNKDISLEVVPVRTNIPIDQDRAISPEAVPLTRDLLIENGLLDCCSKIETLLIKLSKHVERENALENQHSTDQTNLFHDSHTVEKIKTFPMR